MQISLFGFVMTCLIGLGGGYLFGIWKSRKVFTIFAKELKNCLNKNQVQRAIQSLDLIIGKNEE